MSLATFFSTFIIAWFLLFLMVLPFGNQPSPSYLLGAASGAPLYPRLALKVGVTTFLALCVVGFIQLSFYFFLAS